MNIPISIYWEDLRDLFERNLGIKILCPQTYMDPSTRDLCLQIETDSGKKIGAVSLNDAQEALSQGKTLQEFLEPTFLLIEDMISGQTLGHYKTAADFLVKNRMIFSGDPRPEGEQE